MAILDQTRLQEEDVARCEGYIRLVDWVYEQDDWAIVRDDGDITGARHIPTGRQITLTWEYAWEAVALVIHITHRYRQEKLWKEAGRKAWHEVVGEGKFWDRQVGPPKRRFSVFDAFERGIRAISEGLDRILNKSARWFRQALEWVL